MKKEKSITFFLVNLNMGGDQKTALSFIKQLIRMDIKTVLVVLNGEGLLRKEVPEQSIFFDLKITRTRWAFFRMWKYLVTEKPNLGISSQTHLNVLMIILKIFCGYPKYLVVREHITFNKEIFKDKKLIERLRIWMIKWLYPISNRFEVVSANVENSIREFAHYQHQIIVLQNGVDFETVHQLKQIPTKLINPQSNNKKYIVGIGRFSIQKNFSLLLEAFSLLNDQLDA